ncbi:interferon-induced protein 44-like [Hippopotamus amphibius kiboko]|uniref:interferon-induced protein 44-like n=1 Tax=Hippopotamus amphibius kiboko TaxID=575201 RepID=UPI0025913703|nr:interferon-induced protein 44-like [Hippopotamus amphibius kiboko]
MAVTTKLTWNEEKSLQKLLGNVSLRLLYKYSVHGDSIGDMPNRCLHQGSTITLIYGPTKIYGIFLLGHCPEMSKSFREPNTFFSFSFQRKKTMEMTAEFLSSTSNIICNELIFEFCNLSKHLSLDLYSERIFMPTISSKQSKLKYGSCSQITECEVFRVEGIKDDAGYINRIMRATRHRSSLLADLRAYRPYADLVSEIRILLVGPVGSGKSSFFNSVKSIFQGHLTHQAIVGSDVTSITEQYRIYSIKDGKDGISLPFMLCDSMGLDEKKGVGLCVDDVPHILKGCVPDRYQFSPHKPITPKHPSFITSPTLKDRIHCVAYVCDINSIDNLSSKMVGKFKQIQKEVLNCGVAHVALLTKMNNCNEVLQDNFLKMNKSMISQSQIQNVNKMLGIPLSNILVVENYASGREMDPLKDILILSALKQMLRAADDFLEDLPLE